MNISLSDKGKKMSFKMFVDVFGKHFNSYPDPESEMKLKYTELTGKKVGDTGTKRKKSKGV